MKIKRFSEINDEVLEKIINKHFSHWSQYSDRMNLADTSNKFKNIYTIDTELPYGLALFDDNNNLIGFCVLKLENLIFYPEYFPWISDVMIFDDYRGMGNGRTLINFAKEELKKIGFEKAYLWTDKAPGFYKKIGFSYVQEVLKSDESGYGELYTTQL